MSTTETGPKESGGVDIVPSTTTILQYQPFSFTQIFKGVGKIVNVLINSPFARKIVSISLLIYSSTGIVGLLIVIPGTLCFSSYFIYRACRWINNRFNNRSRERELHNN